MSRKDKIMALAISNTKKSESLIRVKPANTTKNKNSLSSSDDKQAARKSPILTDLDELWSRPLDFNKYPAIFENQNEYCNSFEIVQDLDLLSFTNNTYENTLPSTRQSLICYENLPDSDDDRCDSTGLYDSDDSVKDKDYNPKSPDYNSDSSNNINEKVPITVTVDAGKHTDSVETDSVSSYDCNETRHVSIIVNAEIHDERERKNTRNGHEMNNNNRYFKTNHNVIETDDIIELENVDTQSIQNQMEDTDFVESAIEKGDIETSSNVPECEKGLTKLGLPRKRRKFEESLHERKRQKKEAADEKLTLKPPCTEKCRKKCTTKFTEGMRKQIHDRYINLCWESRGLFIKGHVESRNVRTRTKQNDKKRSSRVSFLLSLHR
ncbi:uncharacterized protein LOC125228724 [Leguminivora glycinivorella]|uniref:uncharacterized protein LOC125228724 n=2 Tax=Leguminivora glycinivorella TaxID=1035111 RepID=UPI002010C3A3|nr:uncharacterized protein LOC125228724 [Leguminivora glycinivorella]